MRNRITYTTDLLQTMALFEKITPARLRDCFFSREKLIFVVKEGEIGRALGRNKTNVERLEHILNKKIKIVEFNDDMVQFIINLMAPLRVKDIREEDGLVTVMGPDTKTKGLMIGSRAQNLREYENIVRKYFDGLKEIRVV